MDNKANANLPRRRRHRKTNISAVEYQTIDFQRIFDNFPEVTIVTDDQGRIQYLNKEAKSLFGEQTETLELKEWPANFGLYLDDGLTPYPVHRLPLNLALQGEAKQEEELILRKEEEAEGIWISMSSQPLTHKDGRIDGTITFIRDITYRKQIEHSRESHVRRTEALYKLSHNIAEAGNNLKNLTHAVAKFTSEIIGDLSVIVLKDGDDTKLQIAAFFDTNPTGQALMRKLLVYGDQIDEEWGMVGRVIKSGEPLLMPSAGPKMIRTTTLPEFKEFIERVGLESILIVPLTGRGSVLGAISLYRHHGSQAFKMDDQSFLMDIAYRTSLAIENYRLFESLRLEIAERLSTKQKLDTSEERFRAIFESTTLGIKVLDLDGNILQANAAFQSMLGYSDVELLGRHFGDFLFRADVPRALKLLGELKTTGLPQYLFEHRIVQKNDSIVWAKTTFSPIKRTNGDKKLAYIVGIVENISEQKTTELEMKELRDRLQKNIEMERLKLAQELHDNPMQALYSVMYKIDELRPIAEPSLAKEMEEVTIEVKSVIDNLRTIAKELRPPALFDLGLENAIRSYTDDILKKKPNLKISLSLAKDRQLLPEEMRLALFRIYQQSLTNILRHAEATEVKVRFLFDAEEVRLEISDNGKGFKVPSNWIEFVRQGHYGLAGISERVSSLRGTFKLESQPGNNTSIIVTIPWHEEQ